MFVYISIFVWTGMKTVDNSAFICHSALLFLPRWEFRGQVCPFIKIEVLIKHAAWYTNGVCHSVPNSVTEAFWYCLYCEFAPLLFPLHLLHFLFSIQISLLNLHGKFYKSLEIVINALFLRWNSESSEPGHYLYIESSSLLLTIFMLFISVSLSD